jgi:DnaK suppressor protein
MNVESLKKRLLAKQDELSAAIRRLEDEARTSQTAEVEDPIDRATSSEAKAEQFQEVTLATATLDQVQAALQRMDDGSYGVCIDCGRPIEPARLEAVPWTPYCKADQEKHDRASAAAESQTGA